MLDTEASDRALHTVGSRNPCDETDGFRTPPLLYIGATAPYFHDGRYSSRDASAMFYAESWALTHMLMFAPAYSSRFGAMLHLSATSYANL